MMKRVLSGIQPSGQLHLGNYAGAVRQFIQMQADHEMFIFVATYHALTSGRDAEALRRNTHQVVVDYLAFGLDPDRTHIYLQTDVPEVHELAWLLGCVCPPHLMDKATSYKDKLARGLPASIGLYTYPILQAADILCVDADLVPVGKDQVQHIEITRDLAEKFNHYYGPVFKLPEARVPEDAAVLPGIDGQKMSKSYGNTIDPFLPEKQLRKLVMKIKTDSTPVEEPKDPEQCPVFQIYRAMAGREAVEVTDLANRYRRGGMGYGEAKQQLFEFLLDHFAEARRRREELAGDHEQVARVLQRGAEAARGQISQVLGRARQACGLR